MIYRNLPLALTSALAILWLQACSTPQAQKSPEEVALSYLKALESKDIEAVTELTHIENQFRQAVPELTEQLSQSFERQGGIKKLRSRALVVMEQKPTMRVILLPKIVPMQKFILILNTKMRNHLNQSIQTQSIELAS